MENRICIKCRETINPLRIKALPTAKTCVECSTTGAKRGVPMMFGEKDHTWTDIVLWNLNNTMCTKSNSIKLHLQD
jgi:hypothetical protein